MTLLLFKVDEQEFESISAVVTAFEGLARSS